MKRRIKLPQRLLTVSIVLAMLFSTGIMQAFSLESKLWQPSGEVHGQIAPLNSEFQNYLKSGETDGEIPSSLDLSYLSYSYEKSGNKLHSVLPESYDLRDYGLISPVPDQGIYDTCWSFGTLGSAESALMKKQQAGIELSEKHLLWFSRTGNEENEYSAAFNKDYDPYFLGGNMQLSLATLAAWKGPVYSYKLPYEPSYDVDESMRYDADFHLQDCVYMNKGQLEPKIEPKIEPSPAAPDTDLLKQLIMDNGAYELSYKMESLANEYYNDKTFAIYHDEAGLADHSNVIVGWDDNFSKDNFAEGCRPEHDGAWLIRNSWGTDWGDNGYFWISYEDKTIDVQGSSFTFENNDNYAKNYQYDTMGWCVSAAADDFVNTDIASKSAYISNLFTSETDEQLEAVSFYTTDVGTEYEISVYTGAVKGDPTSGKLVYSGQSGSEYYCGYHTVELNEAVALKKSECFSVVVKLTNPDYAYPIAAEACVMDTSDREPQYMGNGGESYYSADGKSWTDIVKLGKYAQNLDGASFCGVYTTNVCLKAFTNPLPECGTAIGNVDFSLLEGEVALGSELTLSGADDIYYTITPEGKTAGEKLHYTAPVTISEPCTVSAWGEENGKTGNVVSQTYSKATAILNDLMYKNPVTGKTARLDPENLDSVLCVDAASDSIQVRAFGQDEITVNGVKTQSNAWSDAIPLDSGKVNEITLRTEETGKTAGVYTLKIYRVPFSYDYEKETIHFDKNAYSLTDAQGKEINDGDSVTPYITDSGTTPEYFSVTEKLTGNVQKADVQQRAVIPQVSILFDSETTSLPVGPTTNISYNEDMSGSVPGNYDYITVEPGKDIYLKRFASSSDFATATKKIEVPDSRPETPSAEIEETGADNITVVPFENGEYRIAPDGEWQTDNCLADLEPDTDYTAEVRVGSTETSFASLPSSAAAKTQKGVSVPIIYSTNGFTVASQSPYFKEGATVVYPEKSFEDEGYTFSEDDLTGITVTVTEKDGVLCADTEKIEFNLIPSTNPADYSYTVNYWNQDGSKLLTKSYPFSHTDFLLTEELPVPDGYEAVKLRDNTSDGIAASLTFENGKWIVKGSEINLIVKKLPAKTTIQIVHTNDIHGYYTATSKGIIGFAELKTLIDSAGADLVLDAGDTYHGQAFATVERGQGIAELMKAVGYDAMTPGNHDWSYGADRLKELEKLQGFPILAANVTDASGNAFFDTQYLVKEVTADDGTEIKVGVIGVIDDGFYDSTASDNVKGLAFKEEASIASALAKKLKEQKNCDIVIALTHNPDCESFVGSISDVDAVIAGHQHILIDKTYTDKDGKNVPVVEAGYYFYNIGVLSLTYDTITKTVSNAGEKAYTAEEMTSLGADSVIAAKISSIESRENGILSDVIGNSNGEYAYSWEEIRVAEQQIGRIVTAAYLDRTGADVAFENAGGIRGGIPKGNITYKDLISISPYGNTIVTKEITGKQLLALVEYSLEISRKCDEIYTLQKQAVANGEDPYQYSWPSNSGSVLQFGGINVKYDITKPEGSRIVSAEINGNAVEADKLYTVATNNYAAENTEYTGLSSAPLVKEYGTCEQALLAFIKKGTFETAALKASLTAVSAEENKEPEEIPSEVSEPEKPDEGTIPPYSDNSQTVSGSSPKTGDAASVVIFMPLLLLSGSALIVLVSGKKRRIQIKDEK